MKKEIQTEAVIVLQRMQSEATPGMTQLQKELTAVIEKLNSSKNIPQVILKKALDRISLAINRDGLTMNTALMSSYTELSHLSYSGGYKFGYPI